MHRVQQVRRCCTVLRTVLYKLLRFRFQFVPDCRGRSSVEIKSPKGHTYVIEARTEKSNGKDPQVCVCFEGKKERKGKEAKEGKGSKRKKRHSKR